MVVPLKMCMPSRQCSDRKCPGLLSGKPDQTIPEGGEQAPELTFVLESPEQVLAEADPGGPENSVERFLAGEEPVEHKYRYTRSLGNGWHRSALKTVLGEYRQGVPEEPLREYSDQAIRGLTPILYSGAGLDIPHSSSR